MFGWLARKAVGAVRSVVNTVKRIFGSGEETARKVAEEQAYERERASAEEAARINRLLASYKNDAVDVAKKLEMDLAQLIDDSFSSMRERLDEFESNCELLDLHPVRKRLATLAREARKVDGILEEEIIPKISLDNEGCCEILKMQAGPHKMKAMRDFIGKNLVCALNSQKRQLKSKLTMLEKELSRRVMDGVESTLSSRREAVKLQEELVKDVEGREALLADIGERICAARHAANLFDNHMNRG